MTHRELLLQVLDRQVTSRVPNYELACWGQTVERWLSEGMPANQSRIGTMDMFEGEDLWHLDRRAGHLLRRCHVLYRAQAPTYRRCVTGGALAAKADYRVHAARTCVKCGRKTHTTPRGRRCKGRMTSSPTDTPDPRTGQTVAESPAIISAIPAPPGTAPTTVAAPAVAPPQPVPADRRRLFARRVLRALGRCYPLLSGCGTLSNTRLFRWAASGEPAIQVVRLRNGARLYINLADFIGRAAYFFGDLDPKVTRLCQRILRPGDTFVDIGANCGLLSFYGATGVGKFGHVHAFEPQPNLVDMLRLSVARNGYHQVRVHPLALSDRDDVMTLAIPEDNCGAASLVRRERPIGQLIAVPVARAGAYLAGLDPGRPGRVRLMKLDVEGHEPAVLHGAAEFLHNSPPAAIIFESNDPRVPVAKRREITLLLSLDYRIYSVERSLLRLRLKPLDTDTDYRASNDYLAIHHGNWGADIARRVGVAWTG
jgi:FkbM family methyltransferase